MPQPDIAYDTQTYRENLARQVPGMGDLHRMVGVLLAERVPESGRVLVVGAGGGLEVRALAEGWPGWRFEGVDPSREMLGLARETLGELVSRVELVEGYVDDAGAGPFDGAVCLLVLHFLKREERLRTLRAIAERLEPGAPLVVMHHSFEADGPWLRRYARYQKASGIPVEQSTKMAEVIAERLPALSPAEDEALLREAGFESVEMFYAAFSFRGWVAYRRSG